LLDIIPHILHSNLIPIFLLRFSFSTPT